MKVGGHFYPDMFDLYAVDFATTDDGGDGNARGGGVVCGGIDAAEAAGPVFEFGFGDLDVFLECVLANNLMC